jgi:hypothetical protein
MTRPLLALTSLLAFAAAALPFDALSAVAAPATRCAQEYGYAGIIGAHSAAGVGARLTALAPPLVRWGHVAAWVGLSSGAPGSASWIQAGFAGFEAGANTLYYEVARAGASPVYTAIRNDVPAGETHAVAVREVTGTPGTWRVWVDGAPASPPISLQGSHHVWRPMVMSESWNGGTGACNVFRFAFADLRSVGTTGGAWRHLTAPRLVDAGYRLVDSGGRLLASTGP